MSPKDLPFSTFLSLFPLFNFGKEVIGFQEKPQPRIGER